VLLETEFEVSVIGQTKAPAWMERIFEYAKTTFIWLVILAIAFVFFSPVAHLEPTALRAARMASALLTSFAIVAAAITATSIPVGDSHLAHWQACTPFLVRIIDLDCTRLC
jgi:hypothetical protein